MPRPSGKIGKLALDVFEGRDQIPRPSPSRGRRGFEDHIFDAGVGERRVVVEDDWPEMAMTFSTPGVARAMSFACPSAAVVRSSEAPSGSTTAIIA